MIYKKWKTFYDKILKDFNFDYEKDFESAKFLDGILSDEKKLDINKIEKLIEKNNILIFGAGPSLTNSIRRVKNELKNFVVICADGATSAFIENEIIPDIIVTDLDGKVSDQINANKNGSIVLIHAHGNNIDKINKYVKKFEGKLIATTQTDPNEFKNLYNFGGFTDGDRCVFLADHFNARKINLLGFDYNGEIGKYSFPKNKNEKIKLKKLSWCRYLIDQLKSENPNIEYW